MIIEVSPKDNCADCVFCSEMIFCNLLDGEHIEFDDKFEKASDLFCPLRCGDPVGVTDKVKVVKR